MTYWLLKTEPATYSWDDLLREGGTAWTGVANPAAQLHLRTMRKGDRALVYHTGGVKAAVGVAVVVREAYPDPTADRPGLACVGLSPGEPLPRPVGLAALKEEPVFEGSPLLRQGRLSVVPITAEQWARVAALAGGGPPGAGGARRPSAKHPAPKGPAGGKGASSPAARAARGKAAARPARRG